MDNTLPCEIVQDLLPSYVDGLTCGATNDAVARHLAGCPDCAAALAQMRTPEPTADIPPAGELDYLKKIRRRTRALIVFCTAAALVLCAAFFLVKTYAFGSPAAAEQFSYTAAVEENTVFFSGNFPEGGASYVRTVFQETDGVVTLSVRSAPRHIFGKTSFQAQYTAKEPVTAVYLDGLIIWENGTAISRTAAQVYAAKNPYVGNMPANGRIAAALGIQEQFGSYKNELHTSSAPYGWTLTLDTAIPGADLTAAAEIMRADAYILLAAIDNLDYVTWTYASGGVQQTCTFTSAQASAFAGRDIKTCADTAAGLQQLMQSLRFHWAGVHIPEAGQSFSISVLNQSASEIYGLVFNFYLDGTLLGSQGGYNADGSGTPVGGTLTFQFSAADFPPDITAVGLSTFSFDLAVLTAAGKEIPVCQGAPLSALYGRSFTYALTGSSPDSYALTGY